MSPSRARSNSHASTNSNSGSSSSTKKKINTLLFHPTAMFEGQELLILTTAEPLLTPVPSSEVVIQGTVIMAWHPSHSSQREARSIFSLIFENAYKASSSLSLTSFLSAWGSGSSSGNSNKKRNHRNNSSGLFFASNISTIAMGIVLLLTLTLMVALYLDGDDGPVGFNRHTEGGPPFVHWAYKDNNSKSKNKNKNKSSRRSSAREKQQQQQQQKPGETEEERVLRFQKEHDEQHRTIINKWDNAVDDEQQQLMITDHGIPIRYDLDSESLLAFRKMTRRAQTAGNDIKTIANTDRQFILAVSGEELDGSENVAASSTTAAGGNNGLREVLLCNKPTDNEQLNEAIRSQKVLSQVSFMNDEESLSSQKKEKRSSKEKFTIADVSPSGNGIGNIGGNGIYNSGFSVGYGPKTVLDRPINPITSRHRLDPKFDYDNEDSNNNDYSTSNYYDNQIDMRDDAQKQNNEMDAHTRKFMDGGACITATLSSLSKPTAEAGHAVAAEKIASSQTFQLSLQQNQNNKQEGGFVSSLSAGSGSSEDHDHQNYQAIPNSPYEAEPYEEPLVQQLGSSM